MSQKTIVNHDDFSVKDLIFMKEHNIRIPKQTIFVSSEQYDTQIYKYSLKISKLRYAYEEYNRLIDKVLKLWSEYLSYMCFLGKKPQKILLPKKRKIYSKFGLDTALKYFSKKNIEIRKTLNSVESLCFLEKNEVLQNILENAIKNSSSDLDVVVLKSDYLSEYKENEFGFQEFINQMVDGSYKGIVGIIGPYGCEHLAFIPKYVKMDRIIKVWMTMYPPSVKCTYISHKE